MKGTYLYLVMLISLLVAQCSNEKKEAPKSQDAPAVEIPSAKQTKGEIQFSVYLDGTPPKMAAVKMNADRKCLAMHKNPVYFQKVLVNEKGMLQNVFIYVKTGLGSQSFSPPSTPVVLDQRGCMYEPHVFGIMVNQPLEIVNSDRTLHNIHALPKMSRVFNIAQPRQGMKIEKMFPAQEIMVPVKCEVHSWMRCYIGVLDHPYFAVSDADGICDIKGLPPGHYVVTAWHEEFGSQDQTVVLNPGEEKKIEFRYSAN